jgi:hypothetical protein
MRRVLALAVITSIAITGRVQAIEMFTNFNNGQNIGFPPLEVPTRIYGGFGRGGWNPHAEGMPLKTNPPVPAMMPTGQIPGRVFDYYGRAPGVIIGNDGADSQRELVSDRRRGRWQRGPAIESRNGARADTNTNPAQAIDAKDASSRRSSGTTAVGGPEPAVQSLSTVLHAQSDTFTSGGAMLMNSSGGERFQDWPKADALFPH